MTKELKDYLIKWFISRGLIEYDYQIELMTKAYKIIESNDIVILAAAPSAGKTYMSIALIDYYLMKYPNSRVLVLAHGTTVLRTQYFDSIKKIKPNFTYSMVEKGRELNKATTQVVITLPQSITRLKTLPKFELLTVDEAHEFYFAIKQKVINGVRIDQPGMVQDIIKKIKPNSQLLLTGTPSKFILNGFKNILPVTIQRLLTEGQITDPIIELAKSSHNFKHNTDFNAKGELYGIKKFFYTESDLDDVFEQIYKRLIMVGGKSPKYLHNDIIVASKVSQLITLKKLDKTMIVCKSQKQAKQAKEYFINKGIKVNLSISDTDVDSTQIEEFINQDDSLILIVVGRGILGFNYIKLVNVIDMTFSINIDKIFQLLSRIIRKYDKKTKLFIKVVPEKDVEYYNAILHCVMALSSEEWFLKYNGKNFLDIPIPSNIKIGVKPNSTNYNRKKKKKLYKKLYDEYKSPDYLGVPVFKWFNFVSNKKGSVYDTFSWTKFSIVKNSLDNLKKYNWTVYSDDQIVEIVVNIIKENNITTVGGISSVGLMQILIDRKLKDRVIELTGINTHAHLVWVDMANEEIIEHAKKIVKDNNIQGRFEFIKNHKGLYNIMFARKIDIFKEIDIESSISSWKSLSDIELMEEAKKIINDEKIINPREFSNGNGSLYTNILDRGLIKSLYREFGWEYKERKNWQKLNDKEFLDKILDFIKDNNISKYVQIPHNIRKYILQRYDRNEFGNISGISVSWTRTEWRDMSDKEFVDNMVLELKNENNTKSSLFNRIRYRDTKNNTNLCDEIDAKIEKINRKKRI